MSAPGGKARNITAHERFFLFPRPALDLPLSSQRFRLRSTLLSVNHLHRSSRRRVASAATFVVIAFAGCEIRRLSTVQAVVCASEEVDVVHDSTTMSSSLACLQHSTCWMARHERAFGSPEGEPIGESNGALRLGWLAGELVELVVESGEVLRFAAGPPSANRPLTQDIRRVRWLAMSEPTVRRRRAVGESNGAEERTRTSTLLRAPAPQAGASANSATSAWLTT